MTDWAQTLKQAVALAATPGPAYEPTDLVARVSAEANPIAALADNDTANEVFDTLANDIGFVTFARAASKPVTGADLDRLVALIRWLKQTLIDWRKAGDPSFARLAAIIVIATKLDDDGLLWTLMPRDVGANTELAEAMAVFLEQCRLTMSRAARSPAPLLTEESIDQFITADATQDWASLRSLAEHHPWGFFASVAITQSVRFLHRFHPALLVRATRSVNQTGIAMQIVSALPIEDAFKFVTAANNPHLQFSAVSRLFGSHHRTQQMSQPEEDALTDLLLTISKDRKQWQAWMKAFNAYPVQTHVMQKALGRSLAGADDLALDDYMRSMVLNAGDVSRDSVTTCLSTFSDLAPLEKRRRAWRSAYGHWSAWNFGEHDGYTKLTLIVQSPIDFAIVGYAAECLDANGRKALLDGCVSRLDEIEDLWHASSVECTASIYRILSQMQPIAHANVAGLDRQNWLQKKNSAYFPNDFKDSRYFRLRYRIQQLPLSNQHAD